MDREKRRTTITLSDRQMFFLRELYGRRLGVKGLVRRAVAEAYKKAAEEYLAKYGYAELMKEDGNGSEH